MDTAVDHLQESHALPALSVDVEGMTCASCSARVERGLSKLPGVSDAGVNLATERAELHFDPKQISAEQIVEAIRDTGYTPVSTEAELSIEGMTCASCVGRVERALNKAPGVLEASVNLATERAKVCFLPAMTDADTLAATVADAGYEAHPVGDAAEAAESDGEKRRASLHAMGRDVALAAILGAVIVVVGMGGGHSCPPSTARSAPPARSRASGTGSNSLSPVLCCLCRGGAFSGPV
ncbi:heavy metal-associated domain-containing protein [Thioclava sp. JM3]|uniref:heavy-metal-associated domain-containing protein n=1 Tax=Thioclava sp. JM3 TaxID=1973004 RepID=UPI002691FF45